MRFTMLLKKSLPYRIKLYAKKQVIDGSKKVGSYVASSIADRIRAILSGKAQNSASISSSAAIKQHVIGMNGTIPKDHGVGR